MKTYLSGPITHATPEQLAAFEEWKASLLARGEQVINPKDVEPECPGGCYRNPLEVERNTQHGWECYLRWDLVEMLKCDKVLMLPGWQRSHGARLEHQVAVATGLEVIYHDAL